MDKIKNALKKIKIDDQGIWHVPNRKELNMSFDEFIEFERQRILEFYDEQKRSTKYKFHYYGIKEKDKEKLLLLLPKITQ